MGTSNKQSDLLQKALKEPSIQYASDNQLSLFSEQALQKGKVFDLANSPNGSLNAQLLYDHPHGKIFVGDSIQWLSTLQSETVDLIIADPPYNIKKAEWDTFESQQAYVEWSLKWIEQAARILKPNGTLYVCGFSEILADLKLPALKFFEGCRWLVWHYKNKANLHSDWGRSHESILHFRKSKAFTFNIDDVRIPYGNHTKKYPKRLWIRILVSR